jgi:hypothetical protein
MLRAWRRRGSIVKLAAKGKRPLVEPLGAQRFVSKWLLAVTKSRRAQLLIASELIDPRLIPARGFDWAEPALV